MDEERILKALGFVMASSYRLKVIQYLGDGVKIPSDIANNLGVKTNHISNVLSDLKDKNLVVCLNEEDRKGRLYKNTDLALDILKYFNGDD